MPSSLDHEAVGTLAPIRTGIGDPDPWGANHRPLRLRPAMFDPETRIWNRWYIIEHTCDPQGPGEATGTLDFPGPATETGRRVFRRARDEVEHPMNAIT